MEKVLETLGDIYTYKFNVRSLAVLKQLARVARCFSENVHSEETEV